MIEKQLGKVTLSVSLGLWQDRPSTEVLQTATIADELEYDQLWIGEMATYDAFALATKVATLTESIDLTIGPLAVAVRDPAMIAMGVGSVAELTGRTVKVAIGSSSPVVVGQWHGRDFSNSAIRLAESAEVLSTLLVGGRATFSGKTLSCNGFRLRTAPCSPELTVAAFGPAAVKVAAHHADRMVLNLVTPASAGRLVEELRRESDLIGRQMPKVALWVTLAVDPSEAAKSQIRRGLVPYLGQPGYGEMFIEAGFGPLVELARSKAHPAAVLEAVSDDLIGAVSLCGSREAVLRRMQSYVDAGVEEIVVVPSSCDEDPGGQHSLRELMAMVGRTRG